jgi:hypothetical protein
MEMFISIGTREPQSGSDYAGMTQVVNVSNKTVLVSENGKYMRPREVAMVLSRSIVLQACIKKGWLKVITEVPESSGDQSTHSQKKKKSTTPVEQEQTPEEVQPEIEQQPSEELATEVAPTEQEESL